jgi:hypothetical protein
MDKHVVRWLLTLSACACATSALANFANPPAVMLNPKGLGQVLFYPYYTANNGQDSYVSVTNGSDVGKVVKVTFREGYNGRAVLDFNLYLSPHDVWTAAVSSSGGAADDLARITTSDHSCIPGLGLPAAFSTHGFDGSASSGPADGGPATAARAREGHIEMIAIGDIVPGSSIADAIAPVTDASGQTAPRDCTRLPATAGAGLVAPTSGLFGSGGIIKVSEGTYYAYDALALTGFTDIALTANVGPDHPSLADANPLATVLTNSGGSLTLEFSRGIDAVSAALTSDMLYNEYLVGAGLGANTDWVVTFPTKRFYVDKQLHPGEQTSPFEQAFAAPGGSMINVGGETYDRESGHSAQSCAGGDAQCLLDAFKLPYEVNVISFQPGSAPAPTSSGVLGSALVVGHSTHGDAGWFGLDLKGGSGGRHELVGNAPDPIRASGLLNGLPAIGFMTYNIINTQAQPGTLANYGGLFPHRSSVSCLLTLEVPGPAVGPC